jgi:hypothetical protein
MRGPWRWVLCAIALTALLFGAGGARADWLVLVDGSSMEIDGAPETRGSMVVFQLSDGTLASLKLSEVDLEASARLTAAARERKTAPPASRAPAPDEKKAVFVITDADVRHVSAQAAATAGDSDDKSAAPDAERSGQRLIIRQVAEDDSGQRLAVFGVVENRDSNAAGAVRLTVLARDGEGVEVGRASAGLGMTTLLPGQSTRFEARFEDAPFYESLDFELDSIALKSGTGEGEGAVGEGEQPAEPR